MSTLPANSLVQHLASPVNLTCIVRGTPYARRAIPGDLHIIPEGSQIQSIFPARLNSCFSVLIDSTFTQSVMTSARMATSP